MQANNVITKLKAKHGLLDNAKSELELYDGIEIDASNGMKARMSRATVYSKEHRVVSKQPVDVSMPTGSVHGATMTMRTDTREATFVGNVAVTPRRRRAGGPGQPAGRRPSGATRASRSTCTSEQLYINDTHQIALFTGNVVAVQGDTDAQGARAAHRLRGQGGATS